MQIHKIDRTRLGDGKMVQFIVYEEHYSGILVSWTLPVLLGDNGVESPTVHVRNRDPPLIVIFLKLGRLRVILEERSV